jgi:RimJ/RimL family protein N-acetyltransferase
MVEITHRAIDRSDLCMLRVWRNSESVMPYCRQYRPLSIEDMERWYKTLSSDGDYNLVNDLFVIQAEERVDIGVGGLVRIDWRNRKAEVSLYVANGHQNYLAASLISVIQYSFETLNLHKIYFPVYSFNPYLEVYERHMKREYVAHEEYYWNGKYHDRIILSLTEKQYEESGLRS